MPGLPDVSSEYFSVTDGENVEKLNSPLYLKGGVISQFKFSKDELEENKEFEQSKMIKEKDNLLVKDMFVEKN